MLYEAMGTALAQAGLLLRGGFHAIPPETLPEVRPGVAARAVLLIGSAGSRTWQAFAASRPAGPDPLDRWTRARVAPLAARAGARDVYPGDAPLLPFLAWAQRSEDVHPSPLGLLIHGEYGLWHCYRAALLLETAVALPPVSRKASPCTRCTGRPCLNACPVGAFTHQGFDHGACRAHVTSSAGRECRDAGCRARDACPVGAAHRYAPEQIRFHMAAFHGAPAPAGQECVSAPERPASGHG